MRFCSLNWLSLLFAMVSNIVSGFMIIIYVKIMIYLNFILRKNIKKNFFFSNLMGNYWSLIIICICNSCNTAKKTDLLEDVITTNFKYIGLWIASNKLASFNQVLACYCLLADKTCCRALRWLNTPLLDFCTSCFAWI